MTKTSINTCSRCIKNRNIVKKRKKGSITQKFCDVCWRIIQREEIKEKNKKKRKIKSETRTVLTKKVDKLFAIVVKQIYPLYCHSCGVDLILGDFKTQACHFVERGKMILRFDPRNVLPGCATCNGFDPTHVYELGKKINIYYGNNTAESFREIKKTHYIWSISQLKALAELYSKTWTQDNRDILITEYLTIKNNT